MQNNTATDNSGTVTEKQVGYEDLDELCRQCLHLHDEEVFRIFSRFFSKITALFKHERHQHFYSSARQR